MVDLRNGLFHNFGYPTTSRSPHYGVGRGRPSLLVPIKALGERRSNRDEEAP